ncbi:MAG: prefoldin subunit alpha [Candidatus Lokiarchaeota archaeon]|nr:prefoldin subunit alpha [Candidatus Lokiarchaeota archaeon]
MEPSQDYQEQLQIFRMLKEQRDMYQGQFEILNVSRSNIVNTKITIENIKEGVKVNDEILIPIGGMANIKASINDPEKVLLAITQDVIIEKDLDGAIEILDKRIEQHDKEIQFIATQLQNIDLNLQKTSQLIQRSYLPK